MINDNSRISNNDKEFIGADFNWELTTPSILFCIKYGLTKYTEVRNGIIILILGFDVLEIFEYVNK